MKHLVMAAVEAIVVAAVVIAVELVSHSVAGEGCSVEMALL